MTTYKEITKYCPKKHLTHWNGQLVVDKACEIITSAGCSCPYEKQAEQCTSNKVAKVAHQPYLACIPPGYALVIGAKCHYQVVACEQLSAN